MVLTLRGPESLNRLILVYYEIVNIIYLLNDNCFDKSK